MSEDTPELECERMLLSLRKDLADGKLYKLLALKSTDLAERFLAWYSQPGNYRAFPIDFTIVASQVLKDE